MAALRPLDLKPIGVVRTNYSDQEVSDSWPKGVEGVLEIFQEYADGLRGLEGFSHVIVLAWLHKVSSDQRRVLRVRFRRLRRLGVKLEELPEVGVFASDSPHRPNPIAISIVELRKIEGNRVYVGGLDLYDGTPILDLRAYTPFYALGSYRIPKWYEDLLRRAWRRFEAT